MLRRRLVCGVVYVASVAPLVAQSNTVTDPSGRVFGVETPMGAFWSGFLLMFAIGIFGWLLRMTGRIAGHGGND